MINTGNMLYAQHTHRSAGGPTLLLIHGAGGSIAVWPAELTKLVGIPTLALDLPGHGCSPQPGRRTIGHYADATAQLIRQVNLQEVVVCGHSMGGAIALELARRRLPALRGLVLLGTSGRLRVGAQLFASLSSDFDQAATLISELSFAEDAPEVLRQQSAAGLRRCGPMVTTGDFLACNRFDVTATLPQLTLPALVISGADDRMVAFRHSAATAEALPNSTLYAVEGVGHYVMQEAPQRVAGLVEDFVSSMG